MNSSSFSLNGSCGISEHGERYRAAGAEALLSLFNSLSKDNN
jgi:hypothetical protein